MMRQVMRRTIGAALVWLAIGWPFGAAADWREARTPNFIVYGEASERQLRSAAARLEDFDRLLRHLTNTATPPAEPLAVYLLESASDLAKTGRDRRDLRGFYSAGPAGTVAVAVRGDLSGQTGGEVLQHEYAHHFMMRYHPFYYPSWYVEGFAEYVATARFDGDEVEIGRPSTGRASTLVSRAWLPLTTLLTAHPQRLEVAERREFYAQSWLLVHFLFKTSARVGMLQRYLQALGQRVPEATAFRSAFEMDHAAFETELKRYRDGRIGWGGARAPSPFATASVEIRRLPDAADELLLARVALVVGVAAEKKGELIGRIRKEAAKFPDDEFARRVLARGEIEIGDRAAGIALVDTLLARVPGDAELLLLRGIAEYYAGSADPAVRADRFAAANQWFARAGAADPTLYQAHFGYAATARNPDEALGGMLRARTLAPQVAPIGIATATLLIQRQRFDDAAMVLGPIAANPHGAAAERARDMLDKLPKP